MHVVTFTAYPSVHLGGVSVHARELALALADQGDRVDVATIGTDMYDGCEVADDEGVAVHSVGRMPYSPAEPDARFVQQNLRVLGAGMSASSDAPVDLVTAHGHFFAPAAVIAADLLDAPLVFHAHNMYSADVGQSAEEREFYAAVERQILTRARHVIAISDFIAKMCLDLGTEPRKMSVIPKGLHLDQFAGDWRPPSSATLLYVGRLSPEKGIDVLLEALAAIRRQGRDARLLVAGTGDSDYVAALKGLAKTLDLRTAVAFLGSVPGDRLAGLFQSTSVTVVPSHQEALGRVALEAMASSAPVVVTDTGGLGPLVTPGRTGWRVRPGDSDGLAEAITDCLDHPDRAAQIGRQARAEVTSGYSWGTILDATMDVYETAVRG